MTIIQEPKLSGAKSCDAPVAMLCVDPTETPLWDASLEHCPGATFFHTVAWSRVLKSAYGFKPAYFATLSGSEVRSLLPFMEVSSWLTGRRGVSLPFTDECAPLVPDDQSFRELHQAAVAHAQRRHWKHLECRGGRALFGDVPASEKYFGHRLDLNAPEGALFGRFEGATRRAIHKGEQSNLQIEFSRDLESVRAFYSLLCKTRRRHGVPPQPFHFFACIQRHVLAQNQGWVVLARHNGVPVAGAVYFHFNKQVLYKYGASDEKFQHLRANNLVMWEAIKRHRQDGFSSLDFGRTAGSNEGLRRFKLSWGPTERRIEYVRYALRSARFVVALDRASGWQRRVFRLLPTFLSRPIGAALYPHLA
jgi:hypothetical protein